MTRVLIVDDKEENLYYLQALLTGHGFAVESAHHGAEALVKARQHPPDVIISDLLMPVMDGYTLLRHWKADPRLRQIPFIVYTATYTEPEDERLALNLGADAFILKPSEPDVFITRLREVQAKSAASIPPAAQTKDGDEKELLKTYSETLIRKLEEKTLQLEESNRALRQDIAERKKTEETLRLLNSAVMQTKESILITDAQLDLPGPRIIFVNPAFTRMTGYTAEEVLGKTPRILQGPRTDKLVLSRLRGTLERGEVFEGEVVQYRKDGSEYYQEWQVTHLRDSAGKTTHYVAVQRDVTETKRTLRALRESEEKFSKIFEASPMAMSLSTLNEGRYLAVNLEFLKTVQMSREKVVGHTSLELGIWPHPQDREAALAKLMAQGSLRNLELNILRRDGQVIPILWSVETVRIADEKYLLGSFLDITSRKKTDEELRWKTAFLEAQVDSSLDGILVVDNLGRKILQNQSMNALWKIPPAIANNPDDAQQIAFVAARTCNPQAFTRKINYLNSHQDEISRDEIELVDGTILDRFSSPVRDQNGKHYGRIWTFRDITDQRRLETQFRQAQKMEAFGQLAGGVAHDFNNILAVIQMQAGLLKIEPTLSLEQKEFAGEIEKAAERGANLTRQLLLFSRQQTMQPRDLKLNEVVENMTKMLRRTLGEQFDLQFQFAPEPLYLHADPGMIDQILLNLTVNARDAMPKGGQILIETSAVDVDEAYVARNPKASTGAFVCLRVTDNGSGISPEILPRIFEPFFTTKGVGKGTGLGLATVFGIVQQHKGWIDVSSETGQGTIFQVYLPRLKAKSDTEIIHRSMDFFPGGSETILIVEDEAPLRGVLRVALKRLGYRVLEAASGDEALALWKENQEFIRVVLTDIVMPGNLSGKELGQELLRQNPQLKIIYASGYSQEILGGELPLVEGVNYLAKPFDSRKLAQVIRHNLDTAE